MSVVVEQWQYESALPPHHVERQVPVASTARYLEHVRSLGPVRCEGEVITHGSCVPAVLTIEIPPLPAQ